LALILNGLLAACGPATSQPSDAGAVDAGTAARAPWASRVVQFIPGDGSGFGQERFPEIVLGPPRGAGDSAGSTDVLSLGNEGSITLAFDGLDIVDGQGVDFLVFENPFIGFVETGLVEVSRDGMNWQAFPCAARLDGGTSGCAGVQPVFANPELGVSAVEPSAAGGDGFDLAALGIARARFVRVTDSGKNRFYAPPAGGFDLDAISIVNGAAPEP
jgi:hypothetical protein